MLFMHVVSLHIIATSEAHEMRRDVAFNQEVKVDCSVFQYFNFEINKTQVTFIPDNQSASSEL